MIICLTGFMGCGKSSVGKVLSRRLGCPLIDLDELICSREGMGIPEIFAQRGEAGFRAAELEALRAVLAQPAPGGLVLALGGGTVTVPAAAALVREHTTCFYLKARADSLKAWLEGFEGGRPMLRQHRIEELLAAREPVYESVAHHIVAVDDLSYDGVADAIIKTI